MRWPSKSAIASAKVRGAADAHVVQRLDAPYMVIEVDRAAANLVGLDTYDVMTQVVAAINSSISINRNFWIDNKTGNQYFVAVQYPEDPHRNIEDLLNIPARTANHSEVRLEQPGAFASQHRRGGSEPRRAVPHLQRATEHRESRSGRRRGRRRQVDRRYAHRRRKRTACTSISRANISR